MKQQTQDKAPAAPSTGTGICKLCGETYNRKEVSRIYGNLSPVLAGGYCSSQCYTKTMLKAEPAAPSTNIGEDNQNLEVAIGYEVSQLLNLKFGKDGRVKTSWGSKTVRGLGACITRIIEEQTERLK